MSHLEIINIDRCNNRSRLLRKPAIISIFILNKKPQNGLPAIPGSHLTAPRYQALSLME